MAETKSEEEPASTKRKSDSATADDCPNKSMKLESSAAAEPEEVDPSVVDDDDEDEEEEEDGDYGSQDEGDDDDDAEDQKSNGDAALGDRKGKGILRVDKGKGKMIVDDDDSSDGGSDFEDGGDSELSDDPLAEVDLNNILPSRTRQRQVQPGLYIANDLPNADDDSDA